MEAIPTLYDVFRELNEEDRNISKDLWPLTSSTLNSCDFYLCENLESVVYANNPHGLEALTEY
jgi:hypothetical protein